MDKIKKFEDFLDRMQGLLDNAKRQGHIIVRVEDLENTFPELKKSEDDRIRKLCEVLVRSCFVNELCTKEEKDDCIAWLEKQGEQKSTDKVESKFHKGDWIIFNGLRLLIKEVVQGYYRTISVGGIPNSYDWDIDNVARLWTLDDTRDGDVLAVDNMIFIYKRTLSSHIVSYCRLIDDVFESTVDARTCCEGNTHIRPATKEQRDLLFQKMKEAGFTFDFEKKELKKIEHKPAEWSEEDERKLAESIALIRSNNTGTFYYEKDELSSFLKSLKDRVGCEVNCTTKKEWSEEDKEMIDNIIDYMIPMPIFFESTKGKSGKEYTQEFVKEATKWLKSLKNHMKGE